MITSGLNMASQYTQPDAGCDQRATVVGRLLMTLGYVHRRQVLSTKTDNCRLLLARGNGGRAVAKFSKSGVWNIVPKGCTPVWKHPNSLHSVYDIGRAPREACVPKMSKSAASVQPFLTQYWRVTSTDRQTDKHTQAHGYNNDSELKSHTTCFNKAQQTR